MNLKIEFDYQYKKLYEPIFTTLRKNTKENFKLYHDNIGKCFDIYINNIKWFNAVLLDVYVKKPSTIPQAFLDYDCENVYKVSNISYLVLLLRKGNEKTRQLGLL